MCGEIAEGLCDAAGSDDGGRVLPDRPADLLQEVLGGRRRSAALHADDLLQATLEVGPLKARPTDPEVLRQMGGPGRVELSVDEVLDLVQYLFAANLGQDPAP